jgi:serine/threonine protein kinase
MIPAFVTFAPMEREPGAFFVSAYPQVHGVLANAETARGESLKGDRGAMEEAMIEALRHNRPYPRLAAQHMHANLNWGPLLDGIRENPPSWIKLQMGPGAWPLLPELAPISETQWLDCLAPCFRTLGKVGGSQGLRVSGPSIAILAQEGDVIDFTVWAAEAANAFRNAGIKVNVTHGSELTGGPTQRSNRLQEIFYGHRAVLFFGHLEQSRDGREWGWGLTPGRPLAMSDLKRFLGSAGQNSGSSGVRVPEIVFTACCGGAGEDPANNLFYPGLFINANVRYFVGAWMNVVGPEELSLRRNVVDLAVRFLSRAVLQSDYAIHYLYEAKRDLGFPLIGSLFQIYTVAAGDPIAPPPEAGPIEEASPAPIPAPVIEARVVPSGGIISSVSANDRLSEYVLGQQLWTDSYSRTFWATSPRGNHFVQILTDEWQGDPKLQEEMQAALDRLHKAGLSSHHLVPARAEICTRSIGDSRSQNILALIYDRPAEEHPENWCTLRALRFDSSLPDHFMWVLRLGAGFAELLSELHAQQIQHGNLDPDSIVFYGVVQNEPEHAQPEHTTRAIYIVHIKDAWLRHTPPGRCTKPRYGAPEEQGRGEGAENLKVDCWGLGVILYELATGSSPFSSEASDLVGPRPSIKEHFSDRGFRVPPALERVVRDCLLPSAELRPSADLVWRRLWVALHSQGANLSAFDAMLWGYIRAGQCLFAVNIDERSELEPSMDAIAHRGHPVYVLEEGEGLVPWKSPQQISPWISTEELDEASAAEARTLGLPPPAPTGYGETLAINAWTVLGEPSLAPSREPPEASAEGVTPEQPRGWRDVVRQFRLGSQTGALAGLPSTDSQASLPPVVLLFGNGWWDDAPFERQLAIRRMLLLSQHELHSPIVILAGNNLWLDTELSHSFRWLRFPAIEQADIFDRLLSAHRTEAIPISPLDGPMALKLARMLFPCTGRELTDAIRMCSLQFGALDERVAEMRDELREEAFRQLGTVTYIPVSRLPDPATLGLPDDTRRQVESWAASRGDAAASVPQRLLITGSSGYGKTSLALALGALVRRPVMRIEIARCLQRDLGASEHLLRNTLNVVSAVPGAVVLLDDIDQLFGADDDGRGVAAKGDPTLQRMSGFFLFWLDSLPQSVSIVMTSRSLASLRDQWRRRVDLHLALEDPTHATDLTDTDYREAVFTAVFRRCGLQEIARDQLLNRDLARETAPNAVPRLILHSPSALLASSALRHQTVLLNSPAAIENWIQENILLNAGRAGVELADASFWRSRLR